MNWRNIIEGAGWILLSVVIRKVGALVLLGCLLGCLPALAVVPPFTSLSLAWDRAPSHGPEITYVLRWGTNMGGTTWSTNVGGQTSVTVTNPTSGTLYFSVVAITPDLVESEPSNTVTATNYPAAPVRLRVRTNTTTSLKLEGTVNGTTWIHLATITNVSTVVAMQKNMLFRTSTNLPPLPGGLR